MENQKVSPTGGDLEGAEPNEPMTNDLMTQ